MIRQGLQGRMHKPRRCLTGADAHAEDLSDLLKRDFTAQRVNQRGVGDFRADRHRRAVRCSSRPSRGPVLPADGSASPRSDRYPTAELATAAT